ncbi:hypothetical protein CsSME_00023453 [Camellia sinensis var. sinensis]
MYHTLQQFGIKFPLSFTFTDPYWDKLLWHCFDNNSYQGCPLPERQCYADKEPNLEDNWNYEGGT